MNHIGASEPEFDSTLADKAFDAMEDCPECEGTGETFYSCCGDDLRGTDFEDIAMCPSCHEHLGGPEACDSCGGSGKVMPEPKSICYEEAAALHIESTNASHLQNIKNSCYDTE